MKEVHKISNWKKNTAWFLFGQGVSLIGSSLVGYGVLWYITLSTQSGLMVTLFTIANTIPTTIMAPFGGVWADRFNKKVLINAADGIIAIVTGLIALSFIFGNENLILLLACIVVRSMGQGVQHPAVASLIPELVPEEHLVRVNGIQSTIQAISIVGAPALAGALLSFAPIEAILGIDAVTAILGITILVFFVKVPKKVVKSERNKISVFSDMKEGLVYIGQHSFLRKLFIMMAILFFLLTPVTLLTPLQVARNFGSEVWRLSVVEICFSSGFMLGGVMMSLWGGFKRKIVSIFVGIFVFGMTTVGFGLMASFYPYLICMVLSGIVFPLANTPLVSIIQMQAQEQFRGRVFSVVTMISNTMFPLGMLFFGPLGDTISLDIVMLATGIGILVLSLLFVTNKEIREFSG